MSLCTEPMAFGGVFLRGGGFEDEEGGADLDAVAGLELDGVFDALAVDEGAVAGLEILEVELAVGEADAAVDARDLVVEQGDVGFAAAADGEGFAGQFDVLGDAELVDVAQMHGDSLGLDDAFLDEGGEIVDGEAEAVLEGHFGLPAEEGAGLVDVGLAHLGVVHGQGLVDDGGGAPVSSLILRAKSMTVSSRGLPMLTGSEWSLIMRRKMPSTRSET
jgi:hypothetical protein